MKKVTPPVAATPVIVVPATTKVTFELRQSNGNHITFECATEEGLTQDKFAGTYLFPKLLHIVKGSHKLFDRTLPVSLSFFASSTDGNRSAKVIANVTIKSASVMAVRRAVLTFNETLAMMVDPIQRVSIYALADMKARKGGEYRDYARTFLRPSVPMAKALPIAN